MKQMTTIVALVAGVFLGSMAAVAIGKTHSVNTVSPDVNTQNGNTQTGNASSGNKQGKVTEEQAKDSALKDAKVNASDVTFTKARLDADDHRNVYDIEFYTNTTEYDYEIDATTGAVIESSKEARKVTSNQTANNQNVTGQASSNQSTNSQSTVSQSTNNQAVTHQSTPQSNQGSVNQGGQSQGSSTQSSTITQEQAKNIALANANLKESQVTFTKVKLDFDDGRKIYDIEFYTSTTEYDYEIDAITSKIIDVSKEARETRPQVPSNTQQNTTQGTTTQKPQTQGNSSQTSIKTEEQIKDIVLSSANLTADQVTFTKLKLDTDDGKKVYEVEFYTSTTKYEYEVDATTGRIIETDTEGIGD